MQKVEGSNPFIRSSRNPCSCGVGQVLVRSTAATVERLEELPGHRGRDYSVVSIPE